MLLSVQGIHTYYGASHVLHGVTLSVGAGEVVALLGRNGAGKTTTLRSIMGLSPPRHGAVRFKAQPIAGIKPHRIARMGLAYVPESREPFSLLSVEENLLLAANPASPWRMDDVLRWFPALRDLLGRKGGQLSGGQQQMMVIGRSLLTGPDLLMLDEPSQGLAPVIVNTVLEMLHELKRSSLSVLLVEQSIRVALDLADRVYVISNGRVVLEGEAADLRRRPERVEALVGVSSTH
jgi:branched-chain amino acid transport system ATP-binding protein